MITPNCPKCKAFMYLVCYVRGLPKDHLYFQCYSCGEIKPIEEEEL